MVDRMHIVHELKPMAFESAKGTVRTLFAEIEELDADAFALRLAPERWIDGPGGYDFDERGRLLTVVSLTPGLGDSVEAALDARADPRPPRTLEIVWRRSDDATWPRSDDATWRRSDPGVVYARLNRRIWGRPADVVVPPGL